VIWALALAVGIGAAAGVYLSLSRDLLRCVVGLSILGSAGNLLVFAAGRLSTAAPPIVLPGAAELGRAANPLPQALVLTAIVIGFALTCLSLVLVVRLVQVAKTDDADAVRFAEPPPIDPVKPPIETPGQAVAAGTPGAALGSRGAR